MSLSLYLVPKFIFHQYAVNPPFFSHKCPPYVLQSVCVGWYDVLTSWCWCTMVISCTILLVSWSRSMCVLCPVRRTSRVELRNVFEGEYRLDLTHGRLYFAELSASNACSFRRCVLSSKKVLLLTCQVPRKSSSNITSPAHLLVSLRAPGGIAVCSHEAG